jgi:hypothetical protein
MTTQEKILNYFQSNSELKVLFIFDSMAIIASEIADVIWPDNYVYHEFDGRYFYVKYQLEHDWSNKKVILLFSGMLEPSDQASRLAFPLCGELTANMVYSEENYQSFMQLRNIPTAVAPFIEKHIAELQLSKVDKILADYYKPSMFSLDALQRGLISSYLKQEKLLGWEDIIIRTICAYGLESESARRDSLIKGLRASNDLHAILSEKFEELVGQKYDVMRTTSVKTIAEAYKYNAITHSLTAINADDYKSYKIKDAFSLQRLNSFVQTVQNHVMAEKFNESIKVLAKDIREEKIISWYGTDAEYALMTEELCSPILDTIVREQMITNPEACGEKLRKISLKMPLNSPIQTVLDYLINVCVAYEKIEGFGTYKLKTVGEYIFRYKTDFYLIDQYYRKSIEYFNQFDSTLPVYESVLQLKKRFDADYAKAVNEFNIEWLNCLNESGRSLNDEDSIRHQQNFYSDNVQGAGMKTVVIISDAFRYEVATELMQELGDEKHTAKLDCALAMLPTETKYCKNAMLPQNNLKLCGDSMWVNGKPIENMDDRTKHLQFYVPDGLCINYRDMKNKSVDENREICKRSVVYICHDTIDSMCHDNPQQVGLACKTAIAELKDWIKKLHATFNVTRVILTSDHGFLYNDIPFAEKDKHHVTEDTIETKTRYYLTENSAEATDAGFGISKYQLSSVSGMVDTDVYVAVPNGSNRLYAAGGYEFAHGGATLQELIIPVLYSSRKKVDSKQKVNVTLVDHDLKMNSSILKFTLIQAEAVSAEIRERKIACGVYLGDKLVTKEKEVILNSTDAVNWANRAYNISLSLETATTAPLLELRIFDVEDRMNALVKQAVKNTTLIERDF